MDSYYSKICKEQGIILKKNKGLLVSRSTKRKAILESKFWILNTISLYDSHQEANVCRMPRLDYKQLPLGWSQDGQRSRCHSYITLRIEWHLVTESSKTLIFDSWFCHVSWDELRNSCVPSHLLKRIAKPLWVVFHLQNSLFTRNVQLSSLFCKIN